MRGTGMNDCCKDNDKCRWAVGDNMPGFMPDNHVDHFANWHDARRAFINALERAAEDIEDDVTADETDTSDAADTVLEARKRLRRSGKARECEVYIGDRVYFLSRMWTPPAKRSIPMRNMRDFDKL